MSRLVANTTPADNRRVSRLLIAWGTGDKLALDTVLDEVMADPTGVPGIIFCLTDLTARLGEHIDPDYIESLRATLLAEDGPELGEN